MRVKMGCCDASDVIDAEEFISVMRGSGGNLNSLIVPGVGVHVGERKEGTRDTGREKWLEPTYINSLLPGVGVVGLHLPTLCFLVANLSGRDCKK